MSLQVGTALRAEIKKEAASQKSLETKPKVTGTRRAEVCERPRRRRRSREWL